MRIVIDLQAIQIEYQSEYIDNYISRLTQKLIQYGGHEFFLLLNGMFYDSAAALYDTFKELLPPDHIKMWYSPLPDSIQDRLDSITGKIASRIFTECVLNLQPKLFLSFHCSAYNSHCFVQPESRLYSFSYKVCISKDTNLEKEYFDNNKQDAVFYFPETYLQRYEETLQAPYFVILPETNIISSAKSLIHGFEIAIQSERLLLQYHSKDIETIKSNTLAFAEGIGFPYAKKAGIAHCISDSLTNNGIPHIYVDVSELYSRDARTGIQRVTRAICNELLSNTDSSYIIRPVYGRPEHHCYYYADSLFLPKEQKDTISERPVFTRQGDIFLGLDLYFGVKALSSYFQRIHANKVSIYFVVYDLIGLNNPAYYGDTGVPACLNSWFKTILLFDGALCISQATADELKLWIQDNVPDANPAYTIDWFHLGSDVQNSRPSTGMPEDSQTTLQRLHERPSVLMVATIDPRKGHRQTLAAFEQLWARGVDVNLVFVGKKGWGMDPFVEVLEKHPEQGSHLFWLQGISDEYLEKVYDAAAVALMASEGEGFGLPIVEAARHGKPLLLRDIPVFREIAGEHALYFEGLSPENLACAVERWLQLNSEGRAPSSLGTELLTWKESTQALLSHLPLMSQCIPTTKAI